MQEVIAHHLITLTVRRASRFPSSQLTINAISRVFSTCATGSDLGRVSATSTVNDEWCRNARCYHAGLGLRLRPPRRHNWYLGACEPSRATRGAARPDLRS
jgi:hypothetical protein